VEYADKYDLMVEWCKVYVYAPHWCISILCPNCNCWQINANGDNALQVAQLAAEAIMRCPSCRGFFWDEGWKR